MSELGGTTAARQAAGKARPAWGSRREIILVAAIQIFADRGFNGASTRDIAEAAGIKHPLLFYHFKSKADLYLTAVEDQINKLAEGLDRALADQTHAYVRLETFVRMYVRYFAEIEPGLTVTLRELNGLPPDVAAAIAGCHRRAVLSRLEHILTDGAEAGTFRPLSDVAVCALAIVGILHTFLRSQAYAPGRFAPENAIDQVLQFYAAGLLPGVTQTTCSPAHHA